jgi:hypothetical protein
MSADLRQALEARAKLITDRANQLLEQAQREHAPWLDAIEREASASKDPAARRRALLAVAAYRDRYGVTAPRPLGARPATHAQQRDRNRVSLMVADLRPSRHPDRRFGPQTVPSAGRRPPALSL